jgi:MinD-like ATPase involved in chromosome partitioning or flagellar assembly
MEASTRIPRRSGSALASISVGRVELLARGRWHRPPPPSRATRVIAIGSSGGRVGQSTIAAHLAVALANLGAQVIAVDMDLRAPALPRLLAVETPTAGWRTLLADRIQTLEAALIRTPVRNLQVVSPGALLQDQATSDAGALDANQRRRLVNELRALDGDMVIIDLGAQDHAALADFFSLAEMGLLVASRRHSSLSASLGFLAHAARCPTAEGAAGEAHPAAPAAGFRARLVGNQAIADEDVEVFHAFSRLARAELAIDLPLIGCVRTQDRLGDAEVSRRTPLRHGAFDGNAQTFLRMGESLLHEELGPAAGDVTGQDLVSAEAQAVVSAEVSDGPSVAPLAVVGSLGALGAVAAIAAVTPAATPAVRAFDPSMLADPAQLLSIQLDRHCRKHLRHGVDWVATLEIGGRLVDVRVVDVSLSGAALEMASTLTLGASATLRFDQLPGQPLVPVIVQSLQIEMQRAGVDFVGTEVTRQALVAAAQDQRGPVPERDNDEEPTSPLRVPGAVI